MNAWIGSMNRFVSRIEDGANVRTHARLLRSSQETDHFRDLALFFLFVAIGFGSLGKELFHGMIDGWEEADILHILHVDHHEAMKEVGSNTLALLIILCLLEEIQLPCTIESLVGLSAADVLLETRLHQVSGEAVPGDLMTELRGEMRRHGYWSKPMVDSSILFQLSDRDVRCPWCVGWHSRFHGWLHRTHAHHSTIGIATRTTSLWHAEA